MRKISDFRNEEALDLLVKIIDPAVEIMNDQEAVKKLYSKDRKLEGVKDLIANHKRAVIEILAAMDGEDPQTYSFSALALPIRLLEILNDKELLAFFTAQQSQASNGASGDAMENIEDEGS